MLNYIYVDLLTHRVFRVSPYDHRFIPPFLDGVLGMVQAPVPVLFNPNACWSKYNGLFTAETSPSVQDKERLEKLNYRCEALELLYRTVFFLRKPIAELLPLDHEIVDKRADEARIFLKDNRIEDNGFLKIYAEAQGISLKIAAQKCLFLEMDKTLLLKESEKLKLHWENIFLKCEDPAEKLEQFKTTVYLG